MNIIISEYSGYCYGVKKAIDTAYNAIEDKNTVYSLGDIIHNKRAVQQLSQKGLRVVDDIGEDFDNILFRSHGVEKKHYDFAQKHGIEIIDTTCVFVKKIQDTVEKSYKDGKKIIIAGDKNHPEVIGINSRCDYTAEFITAGSDIDEIDFDDRHEYILVFQTTFNTEKYEEIISGIKKEDRKITLYNTICNATKKRQDAAVDLSKKVDMMVVIGDKKSSNSKKLFDLTSKYVRSVFIEDIKELEKYDFSCIETIGVTAGASTPDFVIDEVTNYLRNI